jgi:hypothetical protein
MLRSPIVVCQCGILLFTILRTAESRSTLTVVVVPFAQGCMSIRILENSSQNC